jgi:PAS domain S-box-containing protein
LGEDTAAAKPPDIEDLEDLFENAPCGYISAQPDGRISKTNQTFAAWTGYGPDQLVGRRFQDLLNIAGKIYYETHFAPLLRMQGFFNEVALDLVCANGSVLPVLVNAVERRDVAGGLRFIRVTIFNSSDRRRYERELLEARRAAERANADVRELNLTLEARIAEAVQERLRVEETLRQSQKMDAVGQLTGGLAHDFNNLLTGISGSLELLQIRLAQGRINDLERYIVVAQGASKRAAALTHRLLAFARRQTLDPKPTDVNRLVAGMEELIRRTMGPAVVVEVVAAGGLWATLVDPNQLENALLNLCINARDAMLDGGRLTIETGNRWLDDRAARDRDLPAGQYVSLCVSDTGPGMPPDVIARAFDPFFTTKPPGQGTGLGLSMIYGFVRQSGGQARIYSEQGQGTMVCLYLPRHLGETEGAERLPDLAEAPRAERGETVLVVDDEPAVRMLVTEVLEDLGYVAIEAADGPSGLKLLQSDRRIDLLVSDVGLPGGMNGRQLADAARIGRPALKVLFITGYAENAVVGNGHLEPGMHVLTKPFAMEMLASRIKAIITGA